MMSICNLVSLLYFNLAHLLVSDSVFDLAFCLKKNVKAIPTDASTSATNSNTITPTRAMVTRFVLLLSGTLLALTVGVKRVGSARNAVKTCKVCSCEVDVGRVLPCRDTRSLEWNKDGRRDAIKDGAGDEWPM